LLSRRHGAQLRDAERLLLDSLQEMARELEADVRLEKDATDFAQSLLDVGFGEDATPAKAGERSLELFTELVKPSRL
jgi:hypothetical protein